MTAELCYIGKTGTRRISSVSTRLEDIARYVATGYTDSFFALLFVNVGNNSTVSYIFSSRPRNTAFNNWQGNIRYMLVAGYESDERLAFYCNNKIYYLVDMPTGQLDLFFRFRARYSITVAARQAGPNSYVVAINTASTIRVDLQYNNQSIQMKRTWYCRLKVFQEYNDALHLIYTGETVTVSATATYCTIPKIEYNTSAISGAPVTPTVSLYLEYSFDKSDWTRILLHTFTTGAQDMACDDKTDANAYRLETVYE